MSGYNYGPLAEEGYDGDQSYEMQPQRQQALAQGAFLAAVDELRDSMKTLENDFNALQQLQKQSLNSSSPEQYNAQIDEVRAQYSGTNDSVHRALDELFADASATPAGGLRITKERQLGSLKQQWRSMTQQMIEAERDYQKRTHARMYHEYKTINPNATEQDFENAAERGWGQGGGFVQAIAQSSMRTESAQNTLQSLQSRASEMQQLERSIAELTQMFEYMDKLVVQQNDTIVQIEHQADQTVDHLVEANKHQTEAIKSARSWRKYKWWCLLVVVLILIAIAVGVAVGVKQAQKATGK